MTASSTVRRQAASASFMTLALRWLRNVFWKFILRQSEIERICKGSRTNVDEHLRILRFRTSVALSTALVSACNIIFDFDAFPVERIQQDIVTRVKLKKNDANLMANLKGCLHRCSFVNKVLSRAFSLKQESYSSENSKHEEMLEELWTKLKPDVRRSGGRITKEWGEIGFQGTDPQSDFRGMGVFSLVQLVFFASKYPVEAQRMLAESNHPTRWYPFAITGINLTGFVDEMATERLLDAKLYQYANSNQSSTDYQVENGLQALHEFYCTIFTRFHKKWVDANPTDVMAFPKIFQSLKDEVRKELQADSFRY